MCRWFAYISPSSSTEPGEQGEAALLEDLLVTPSNSISKQVHEHYLPRLLPHHPHTLDPKHDKLAAARNSLFNLDGLGIAWYSPAQSQFHATKTGDRPALYKTISPPINDFNIRSLCANTSSSAVFAHIRASSGSVVQQSNCHPFVFGRHTFMHNGVAAHFTDIRRDLCDLMDMDAFGAVSGSTDSEHVAALYMTILSKARGIQGKDAWEEEYTVDEMAAALMTSVRTVLEMQKRHKGEDMRPSSLNLVATDGRKLVTLRFRNVIGEEPPSLYYSTTAGVTLNRKFPGHPNSAAESAQHKGHMDASQHGKHMIVSSEPTTYDEKEWELVPRNTLMLVDAQCGLKTTPAIFDDSLIAKDPDA